MLFLIMTFLGNVLENKIDRGTTAPSGFSKGVLKEDYVISSIHPIRVLILRIYIIHLFLVIFSMRF